MFVFCQKIRNANTKCKHKATICTPRTCKRTHTHSQEELQSPHRHRHCLYVSSYIHPLILSRFFVFWTSRFRSPCNHHCRIIFLFFTLPLPLLAPRASFLFCTSQKTKKKKNPNRYISWRLHMLVNPPTSETTKLVGVLSVVPYSIRMLLPTTCHRYRRRYRVPYMPSPWFGSGALRYVGAICLQMRGDKKRK